MVYSYIIVPTCIPTSRRLGIGSRIINLRIYGGSERDEIVMITQIVGHSRNNRGLESEQSDETVENPRGRRRVAVVKCLPCPDVYLRTCGVPSISYVSTQRTGALLIRIQSEFLVDVVRVYKPSRSRMLRIIM